jgi:hypothetical protein
LLTRINATRICLRYAGNMTKDANPIRAQWPSGIALQDWAAASRVQASAAARNDGAPAKADGKRERSADTVLNGVEFNHLSSVD